MIPLTGTWVREVASDVDVPVLALSVGERALTRVTGVYGTANASA